MSAQAERNDQTLANDSEWLEFPDRFEISPASVWDPEYEDETTLQSIRVAAKHTDQVMAGMDDEPGVGEAGPRARILDESQVLPSEASFATVTLNQPLEPTAVNGREQLRTNTCGESAVDKANSRIRTLDVSHVLPGEVSYATVMLNEQTTRTYSPLREVFAKSDLDWRKLTVEALLLVSVSVVISMIALRIAKPGIFSLNRTVSTSAETSRPQTEPTVIQTELPTSTSLVPAAVSNQQTEVHDPAPSAPEKAAKLEAAVEVTQNKSSVPLSSEGSQKAVSDEIKLKIPRRIPQQEDKSGTRKSVSAFESSRPGRTSQPRPAVRETEVSKRAAPRESVGVNNTASQIVGGRRVPSSLSPDAPAASPKGAPTSAPVTGGGQRPRTVTPKANP